jgi:flagellar biogenesis protein FliO
MSAWIRTSCRAICALALVLLHSAARAQQLGHGQGVEVSVWRVVGSLAFCLVLAAGAVFALRHKLPEGRWLKKANAGRLKLKEHLPLGQQRGLYLIEVDGREYLALFSQQGVSLSIIDGRPGAIDLQP